MVKPEKEPFYMKLVYKVEMEFPVSCNFEAQSRTRLKRLMLYRFVCCLLFVLLIDLGASAQRKYEKETRIKVDEVPSNAVEIVDSFGLKRRIRWYRESSYSGASYEAKTKLRCRPVSIEFSKEGEFEDLEIKMKPKELPEDVFGRIDDYLKDVHRRYAVDKLQLQYTGDVNLIKAWVKDESADEGLIVHYEWVISAKVDGSFTLFEYLFDEVGNFVKKAQIDLKPTENIEY